MNLYNLNDIVYEIDCKLIEVDQYPRRQNLIISGIPDYVDQNNLERKVIEILGAIGIQTCSYDIAACHRLRKNKNSIYPAQTIVRFVNRKIVEFCLHHRERLLEVKHNLKMNLRFYDNLCDSNESVLKECRQLKKYNQIHEYYIRNGFVKVIMKKDDRPIKIRHPDDLYDMFDDYYDHLDIC